MSRLTNKEFEKIIQDIKNKVYHPVYFLYGEEPYYIDQISDLIESSVLNDMEKEFNQSVFYGRDIEAGTLISHAKRFPMMANHQVIIIKEAQDMKKIEDLQSYIENPQKSTILVFCHKYKKPDKRKAIFKSFKKSGVMFESPAIRDYLIPEWISTYVQSRGLKINQKNTQLLADHLGTDLSKISNEIDKIMISYPKGTDITGDIIENNIGISKDYNFFELQDAISNKNIYKTNQIINYFGNNQKEHHIIGTLAQLYSFFSKLLIIHFSESKDQNKLASEIQVSPFFLKNYQIAARNYSRGKVVSIIKLLRECDMKVKGITSTSASASDLLKELMFKIMH